MSFKHLVTQDELRTTIDSLNALADNLDEHVNQSLSKAHGWNIIDSTYLDTGGNYHTDFGNQSTLVSIPGLYNTGVNNNNTLANPGSTDQHWTMIQSASKTYPGPAAVIETPLKPTYATDGPNSQWIGAAVAGNVTGGTYKFRISFDLTGLNAASAIISGRWAVDNHATALLLNGNSTGYTLPGSTWTQQPTSQFQLSGPFLPGVNTLDFVVVGTGGPASLRVEINGKAAVGGAFSIPGIYNTGVNSDGTLARLGSADQHWTLIQSSSPTFYGPNAYVVNPLDSTWAKNTAISPWIGPSVGSGSTNFPSGSYTYRLTFNLTGYVPGATVLKGTFVSDDLTTAVLLNGQVTGVTNTPLGTTKSKSFTWSFVITSGFLAGVNTLDFVVNNATTHTGLRVEITGTAPKSGSGQVSRVLRLTVGGTVLYIPCQQSGGLDGTLDPAIPVFTGIVSPQSADPATDLTVGSPTSTELVTTFADVLSAISGAASDTLLQHAGSPAETVHSGISFQPDQVFTTGGFLAGRRTVNILISGVQYKIVADTNLSGPLNS